MARSEHRRAPVAKAAELHRQWLGLVDVEGPFLAIAPLKRVWPNGIPDFRTIHPERFDLLSDARRWFETAWEALDREPENEDALSTYRIARDEWVETILRDVVGWGESLHWGSIAGMQAQSPNRAVTVTAQAALVGADGIGALVHVVDPTESLRQVPSDFWAATPVDRLEALLRENRVEIGIVTDGRWWGLLSAAEGRRAASGIVDSLTWVEEPRARDAFLTVIGRQHIIGGDPTERLPPLFADSVAAAEEITEALGAQVRRAVELLVQSFSESASEARRRGRSYPLPEHTPNIYEAAVTVMMRTVFLLFAEERGLLPSGELFDQGYGISGELSRLEERELDESEEALDATSLTWHRLLATSQALFQGASFENLRMPAYGGSLFDPVRFPYLTATADHGSLAVAVSDRVMLHVLRSVQVAKVQGEARRISFRDIDVEQIGYIYEGLLGYTCLAVNETTLGMIGAAGSEPEIPLAVLEELAGSNPDTRDLADAIRQWVAEDQPSAKPPSVVAIAKAIEAGPDPSAISALFQVVGGETALGERIQRWLALVRRDLRGHPFLVLEGGLLVKETPSRRNAGAHYTPRSLAEEVVLHALRPLCYSPGPHQTADESAWRLKSSDDILDLKVADIACGSGAFLVASARYLAGRVVEAWLGEDPANAHRKDLHMRAIRQVVASCLYGADINEMAVEMCKLSLWLVSLDQDLPFSFVDDKVFVGNSLLGLTSLDQLRNLHLYPERVHVDRRFDIFDVDIDAIIRKAVDLRERLANEIDEDDPARTSAAKRRQLNELREVTASLRRIADGVIAAGLPIGAKPGTALDEACDDLRLALKQAHPAPSNDHGESAWLESILTRGLTPAALTDEERWEPLHWVIEAPDVVVDRGGFDAIVGNPAFLHGKKITTVFGKNYRDHLRNDLARGVAGNADLAAYFLLRQAALLRGTGCLGIVVTKSILQSHTKIVGIDQVLSGGGSLVRASDAFDWGPKGAAVSVLKLWLANAPLALQSGSLVGEPLEPARGPVVRSYVGTYPNGDGFRVSDAVAHAWLNDDPELRQQLFPYIRAGDLSQGNPRTPAQYLIDLDGLDEGTGRSLHVLWDHLEAHQRGWRERPGAAADQPERWWDFERSARALYKELSKLDRAIAFPRTSNLLMPRWIPTGNRVDMGVVVFPTESWMIYGQIASSLHYHWVLSYAATTRDDPSYAPRRVSNTFPWVDSDSSVDVEVYKRFEEALEHRCRDLAGLRPVMNAFNDIGDRTPEVVQLRELFIELDAETLKAFGWRDVQPVYGFYERNNLIRFTVDIECRDELLFRLLEENYSRAAVSAAPPKGRKSEAAAVGTETLFS